MAKNTVERTTGGNVISCSHEAGQEIAAGTGLKLVGNYQVAMYSDQGAFCQGVALDAGVSGVFDTIPVLVGGPVIRVLLNGTVVAGTLIAPEASNTDGAWIEDTTDPAGYALEGGVAGEYVDIVYCGEAY